MAASGFTPIQLFRTTTASATPTALSLADGELAINLTDEKLYFKNAAGVVKLLASNSGSAGSVTSVDVSGGTTGLTTSGGPITSSGTVTLAGTLNVANGGTGTTTFTANRLLRGNGTGALQLAGIFDQSSAEAVRITSAGDVGIGTTSPSARLGVNGTGYFNSNVQFFPQDGFRFTSASAVSAMRFGSAFTGESTAEWAYNRATAAITLSQGSTGSALNERMRIDSAGKVLIGGGTINSALGDMVLSKPSGGTATFALESQGSWNSTIASTSAGAMIFSNPAANERMRIDSSGNVGIGNNSPGYRLDITAGDTTAGFGYAARLRSNATAAAAALQFTNNAVTAQNGLIVCTDTGEMVIQADGASSFIAFRTNGAERMRVANDGNVGMGTSTRLGTNETLSVSAISSFDGMWVKNLEAAAATTVVWNAATSGDNLFIAFGTEAALTNRGSITYNRGGGLVAYNVTSDYRAKDIIGPVTDAGATIDALKVYSGKMKGATIVRPMLVAHEAQEVVPYAVTGEKDAVSEDGTDKYQHMDHQSLIPLLIAEVQSLRARVAQLEATTPTITFQGN